MEKTQPEYYPPMMAAWFVNKIVKCWFNIYKQS
jgi:hypothetical protein